MDEREAQQQDEPKPDEARGRQAAVNEAARSKFKQRVELALADLAAACRVLLEPKVELPDRWLRVQRLARIAGVLSREGATDVGGLLARRGAGGLYDPLGALHQMGDPLGALEAGNEYHPDVIGGGQIVGVGGGPVPDNVQLLREAIPALQKMADKQGQLPPREASPFDLTGAISARDLLLEKGESTEEIDAYIAACKASLKRSAEAMGKPREDEETKQAVKAGMAFGLAAHGVAAAGGEAPIGPGAMAGGFPMGPNPE